MPARSSGGFAPAVAQAPCLRRRAGGATHLLPAVVDGRFGLVPYIELRRGEVAASASAIAGVRLPVTSVLVGPTSKSEQPAAIDVVQRLMTTHGYPSVPVSVSEVPYRYPR